MSEASAPTMLSPRVLIPFLLTGTIWGSTWFVITGQIDGVPAAWSVFYRFLIACPALFLVALLMGKRLRLTRPEQLLALGVGLAQFSGNFLFVYHAEMHITSGIVAVMFALLMVPNAIFARLVIGERVQGGFIGGSLVAICGVALLLVHEWNAAPLGGNVGLGIALAVGGMLAASIANVVQANPTGRGVPMVSLLAWAMLYGTIFDLFFAAVTAGPPPLPAKWQFWAGTAYLALIGSVVTFPLHYNLVREIGAGKTAYNGIVTVCVAMLLSTLFEGYRWTALTASGAALALFGMALALRSKQRR
ncbi:DMT family transporter [Erythrobacter dokdonensis]|jgi:drug/metabolite transporter (DMT)-like permease|uniref:Drug/metabolite transporter n=1 Tax=Erythrobacter dokdonensis DSW-74 TaxID=1300349 RepID=A0A1A7BFT7_9SPHN|nr:DMT family transporter [Erythrobacter dokdonensis]MEE4316254.1 DMT family transporter [Erythrobacter sp.]OBV10611.1 Drug/metabolite transporter [Erythrobacter dokdonensis DSW-74]